MKIRLPRWFRRKRSTAFADGVRRPRRLVVAIGFALARALWEMAEEMQDEKKEEAPPTVEVDENQSLNGPFSEP